MQKLHDQNALFLSVSNRLRAENVWGSEAFHESLDGF
ncbi:predicted protein [Botrytis cinerea T4]|uniref:Uncharacterized protein n=1 Tax=Botryotinia fuckeliana (strain T4) TaxID=999810 RepID=G2Y8L2_BOTF4|nr:predicted protein [Botrytis cinerea T4]